MGRTYGTPFLFTLVTKGSHPWLQYGFVPTVLLLSTNPVAESTTTFQTGVPAVLLLSTNPLQPFFGRRINGTNH
jgi:hypothetical protein